MTLTETLAMPAPVEIPFYRRLRAKSASKVWATDEPAPLEQNEREESSGAGTRLSRTADALQIRPKTSAADGKEFGSTSSPPVLPLALDRNGQHGQLQSPPPSIPESDSAQTAGNGVDGTPQRHAQNGPVTPATTPQPVATRAATAVCLPEDEAAKWADEVARVTATTNRVPAAATKKSKDAARFPSRQMPSPPPSPPLVNKVRNPAAGIFNILSKGRKSNAATLSSSSTSSMRTLTDDSRPTSSLDTALSPRLFIEPGGCGIVPQTDAPLSASNGGERDVSVRCGRVTLNITVSSDMNTLDLLRDCSAKLTTPINTATSTVIEMYNQLGLERRVRPYERVRDILSSWDRNSLNCLAVQPAPPEGDRSLGAEELGAVQGPKGFTLQLYHSQQPRRWNKKYVTLLENGQVCCSRKPELDLADKDVVALCHLSDFDVYMPSEAQAKELRTPRKYCYAIKSQQKATVFVNSENFVHFFCTEDRVVADTFHSLVRGWRSWYLSTKQLEVPALRLKGPEKPPQIAPLSREPPKKSVSHVNVNGHKVKVSVDESKYAIGAFEPLLDLGRFDKPLDEFGKDWIPETPQPSTLLPEERMASGTKPGAGSKAEANNGAFAAGALLGDGYEQRKQAQKDRERAEQLKGGAAANAAAAADGPFTEGPSLLNGGGSTTHTAEPRAPVAPGQNPPSRTEPSGWFPSALEHSARNRPPASSQYPPRQGDRGGGRHHRRRPANLPGPLIDLTPKPHEAGPQRPAHHNQRGGRGVRVPKGMTLVDLATTSPGPRSATAAAAGQFPFPPSSSGSSGANPNSIGRPPPQPLPSSGGSHARIPKPLLSPRFGQSPGRCPDFRPPPVPPLPVRAMARGGAPRPTGGGGVNMQQGRAPSGMSSSQDSGSDRGVMLAARSRDTRPSEMRQLRGAKQVR